MNISPAGFRERFALAIFSEGGVILDLKTGGYSHVNASAGAILRAFAELDSIEATIAQISAQLSVSLTTAQNHLLAVTEALFGEGLRREPPDPFRYRHADGGYDVWHGAQLVLHVGEDGRRLVMRSSVADLPLRIYDYVSGIAPKILFLRGISVLHASSCMRGTSLLGISGKSRAGKTTTARTFARHGSPLISEDLLVLDSDLSKPTAFVGGEKIVNQWSLEAGDYLKAGVGTSFSTDGLLASASGDRIRLSQLWFIDASRRGDLFAVRPLNPSDALPLVMANHFLGGATEEEWRRHLDASRTIAASMTAFSVDLPNGLDRLDLALGNYTTKSAS